MTKYPYTATKRFFENVAGVFTAVVDADQLGAEKHHAPSAKKKMLKSYVAVNGALKGMAVTPHNAGSRRGNYPVTAYPGSAQASLNEIVAGEVHGVLRRVVGELGARLDVSSLPQAMQEQIALVDADTSHYRGEVKKIRHLHKTLFKEESACPGKRYDSLMMLKERIKPHADELSPEQAEQYAACKDALKKINAVTGNHLAELRRQSEKVDAYHLNGDLCNRTNRYSEKMGNPLLWHYFAGWAHAAMLDTTRISDGLSEQMQLELGTGESVIPQICGFYADSPDDYTASVADILAKGLSDMRAAVVTCGSFDDLQQDENVQTMCAALGLKTAADHAACRAGATAEPAAKTLRGKCPYRGAHQSNLAGGPI